MNFITQSIHGWNNSWSEHEPFGLPRCCSLILLGFRLFRIWIINVNIHGSVSYSAREVEKLLSIFQYFIIFKPP